jgi:hypothetical protein
MKARPLIALRLLAVAVAPQAAGASGNPADTPDALTVPRPRS